ncbi:uncharacterized protein LOC106754195 [Vigna radiata var. radiata]|uniref:Uncharacterized protein LOC106754195 n=1 Tax=Vigna radiata var. radiata TaxID=3916 RepID=A0A1S3TD36_VIGRR|nr:uncharacterized protein LOC106754195 [Vigna radiata var. radiata]
MAKFIKMEDQRIFQKQQHKEHPVNGNKKEGKRQRGHTTESCQTLKDELEKLICFGHLREFVKEESARAGHSPKKTRRSPERTKGKGGHSRNRSRSPSRHRSRSRPSEWDLTVKVSMPDITFTDRDFHAPDPDQDDPMVITARIAQYDVGKVLVDQGSSVNILYWTTFRRMEIAEDVIAPFNEQIVGFAGERVDTRGYLDLRTRLGSDDDDRRTICTVRTDQKTARQCYVVGLKVTPYKSENRTKAILIDLDPRTNTGERIQPQGEIKPFIVGKNEQQTTSIGDNLQPFEENALKELLKGNNDLFAWSASNMPGIHPSVIAHKLSIFREARPVSQKKRRFGDEKRATIRGEVDKLLKAGFIRELTYPTWLSNVVMVKKANGQWRMCVDFTDLNKACPKDSYPLPNIDRLVDGASGHTVLSFLDAYSGYNQIPMYAPDREKMAFITEQVNYCYEVMSFGFKNAGATYQRLMDKVFHNQIGRCMEVYVDNMVIRSHTHQ